MRTNFQALHGLCKYNPYKNRLVIELGPRRWIEWDFAADRWLKFSFEFRNDNAVENSPSNAFIVSRARRWGGIWGERVRE